MLGSVRRKRNTTPVSERVAMHDGAAELEFPPINSGTPSVDPVFSFWTSSKHAVLCSPNHKSVHMHFMVIMHSI